jgi:hypothetical protein
MRQDRVIASLLPFAVAFAVTVTLFVTAPKAEDFWWTDAPSFALNGELVRDYFASGLHQSPIAFANQWFRHYPALSISLYPPVFPLAEALMFALFGFSHPAAQATVAVFIAVAALAVYRVARPVAGPPAAAAAILLTFSASGILLWSRQVMMELPSLAFLLLAAGNFLHHQTGRRTRDLMLAAFFTVCAVYTKQPAIFVAPAFVIALLFERPGRTLRDRIVWLAAALSVLALLPLAAFTFWVQRDSLDVALGQGIAAHSGAAGLLAGHLRQIETYVLALPEIVGWPLLIGALAAVMLMSIRGWRSVAERRLAILMMAWFGCDFVGVALTGHFEARYGMALGVPCAILSLLELQRLPMSSAVTFAAAAALFAISVATGKVNTMAGYDKVAAYILAHTKPDDVVWFEARESKNLIFSLRSHDPLHPLLILRCEKFLIDYHVTRDWGVRDRGWTQTDIENLIDRNKVKMVLLQPDFWTDLPSMALMQSYVLSGRFKQVAEFPITADDPSQRTTIKLFVDRRPADGQPVQSVK